MQLPLPDDNMDEIWQDFYATQVPRPSDKWLLNEERKKVIHFVWVYNVIACTGTKTPEMELAKHLKVSVDEVVEMIEKCLDLRLLTAPKRGSHRCELSMIAVRMIGRMGIGI